MKKKSLLGVLSALACTLALVLASVSPALAATTGSITITSDANSTSDVYQLITTDWTDGSTNGPTYKWNSSVLTWLKTQNGSNGTQNYSAYYNQDGTVSDKFTDELVTDGGKHLQNAFSGQNAPDVTDPNNKAAQFFNALRSAIVGQQITGFNKVNAAGIANGNKVENLTYGSYLIITTSTPDASLTNPYVYLPTVVTIGPSKDASGNWSIADAAKNLNPNVTVKATKPTLTKTEQVENKIAGKKGDTAAIGDTVTFTLTATVPAYSDAVNPKTFKITDTMSKGLAYTSWDDVTIKSGTTDLKSSFTKVDTATSVADGKTQLVFEPTDYSKIRAYQNSTITITYKAKITSDAQVNTSLQNEAKLEYNNGSVTDKTDLYTFGIDVFKHETGQTTGLEGAEFDLYATDAKGEKTGDPLKFSKVDGKGYYLDTTSTSTKLITGADGKLRVFGVDAGKYVLVETKAPNGYQLLQDGIPVEVKAATNANNELTGDVQVGQNVTTHDTGYVPVDVANTKGFSLPKTGGAGTLVLTAAGVVLLGGAALLLTRLRRQR